MGHFAKIENNVVVEVLVANNEMGDWLAKTFGGVWVKTSYNTRGGVHYNPETGEPSVDQSKALRGNYAGIGYTYYEDLDAFIPPKPDGEWVLNEETFSWEPVTEDS